MSEYRYFRSASGGVVRSRSPKGDAPYVEEVKVVPLDAVVIEGPLPEITEGFNSGEIALYNGENLAFYRTSNAERDIRRAEARVRDAAALLRHLREHPPVGEAPTASVRKYLTDRRASIQRSLDRDLWHPKLDVERRAVDKALEALDRVEGASES